MRVSLALSLGTRCGRRLTLDRRSHRYRECGGQLRRGRGPDPCNAAPIGDCMRATVVSPVQPVPIDGAEQGWPRMYRC
jgi:hypothetical protein